MSDYGNELRGERAKYRVSQQELADRSGVSRVTIIDIESGTIEINQRTFRKLVNLIRAAPGIEEVQE